VSWKIFITCMYISLGILKIGLYLLKLRSKVKTKRLFETLYMTKQIVKCLILVTYVLLHYSSVWWHYKLHEMNRSIYRKSPNKRRVSIRCRVSNRRRGSRSIVRINARSQLNAGFLINDMNEFDKPSRKVSLLL